MKNRIIVIAVLGAAAIGGALYVRSTRHGELAEQARADVNDLLSNADGYSTHKAFLDAESDAAHSAATDAAFDSSGVGQATFDPNTYTSIYLNRLIVRAREANKPELVEWLKGLCFEANVTVTS